MIEVTINFIWKIVLPEFKVEIWIIKKLKKHIIPLLKLLERINFKLNFFDKKNKTSWCRCLLSGFKGENSLFSFLKIENRFSKQGYHNNNTTKKGEIFLLNK